MDRTGKLIVATVMLMGGSFLMGSAVSDLMRPACPVAPPLPEFGAIAPPEYRPVRYVLPLAGETTMPPVARRGDVRVVVEFIAPEAIASACAGSAVAVGTYGEPLGCTALWPGRPTMVLPNPCAFPFSDYATLVCHELGHVNGWRHEREDGA